MLQKSLLFLHTDDDSKNYSKESELSSIKTLSSSERSTLFAICLLISILGLLGNGITFLLLSCKIPKTKFTIYVGNMAVGDFLALLQPFIGFMEFFVSPFVNTQTGQLMLIMFFFGHDSKSYFLAAMSTERCLTVFSPVWYQSHRPKCSTPLICAFLWTLSVIVSVLDHFLCTEKYIAVLSISRFPCKVVTIFTNIILFIVLDPSMVFSTSALFIRMKRKPQQDLPARLDISILVAVVLHVIFSPSVEIIGLIVFSIELKDYDTFFSVSLVFYFMSCTVSPFVYLLVGCWKREKGEEPFYMFLERALKDERKGRMRTQPDQEQG